MPIKSGATVRQFVPVITGTVVERKFSDSHEEMAYLVVNTDADGVEHSRWFLESQIEEVAE